jgi:MFS superfamily sulfate permease-like transporter
MSAAQIPQQAAPPAARSGLARNALSSVVVFLVALPLCMGIAIASGAPPVAGLITGVIGGIVVGLLSGSPLLVSGPAAGLAVLVFDLVRDHGLLALGPVLVLAGAIQWIAGRARLGVWFRSVSPGVVSGMLAGIGILIVGSQLHVMFDAAPLPNGLQNFAALPGRLWTAIADGAGTTAGLLGLATIAIMLAWDKLRPASLRLLPGALIAVVLVTLAAQLGQLPVARIDLPDDLLATIRPIEIAAFQLLLDPALLIAALALAFIASAETLLSAAAVDRLHDGARTQYDKELSAQGIGNLLCGVFGGLPMTGVIVRSAANVQAGASSRLSAILHGCWLLLFVLLLPWLLQMTPIAGLAGILVYTGVKMINPAQLREFADYGRGAVLVFVATAVTIVATDLLTGVLAGMALSLLRLALRAATLHVNLKRGSEPKLWTLRLVGSATFLSVPRIARALDAVPPGSTLQLDAERLRYIDHACLMLLRDWARTAPASGRRLLADQRLLDARAESAGRKALVQALS